MKNIKNFFLNNRQKIDNKKIENNKIVNQIIDKYEEIGKLVKEARLNKNLSIKDLSLTSKIPESTIDAIENNIKPLRPKHPFLRSILFKLEENLSLRENTLNDLIGNQRGVSKKGKRDFIIRKFDFLNSWQGSVIYFLGLLFILFVLNNYYISKVNIIEFKIIEKELIQE